MKRYKLVRIIGGRYFSANTKYDPLEYEVGKTVAADGLGVACYEKLEDVKKYPLLYETSDYFNDGKPVAILQVKPFGKSISEGWLPYGRGDCYEGGVNYRKIKVESVVHKITRQQIAAMKKGAK